MSYTINVNGTPHTVDVDGDTPLLWVLRDTLDLKGSKFGCGMGLCGACTVHINGTPTRSCITPVSTVGNAADHHHRRDRQHRYRQEGSGRVAQHSTSPSAGIARPGRSCPPPRC